MERIAKALEGPLLPALRVLLVEDSPGDARLIQELTRLGSQSFDLHHEESLGGALAALRRETFDAVLLDLGLPDSFGLATLSRVVEAAPELPVVVSTGKVEVEMAIEALRLGAQDYILKDKWDDELLPRILRYAVERKHAESALHRGDINDTVSMPAGSTITYTVIATLSSSASGSVSNSATVTAPAGATDGTPGNNSSTDTDTLAAEADLAISKTGGVTMVTGNDLVAYTIVVSNPGPSDVVGTTVADLFPAQLTGVTYTSTATGGATGNTAGSGDINDVVNLPAGSSVTYTASGTVSPSTTGTLSNTATVTPPGSVTDPNPANNAATDTDSIDEADLSAT